MASTALSDPKMMEEHRDSLEVLTKKVERLANLVRASRHFIVFTGAGISTSAGIPDFRGPDGKWTREARGLTPLTGVSGVKAFPTLTHMSLVEMYNRSILKYVISQNCDGLHRRSGLPAKAISELHGNGNIEICEDCDERYFRDFICFRMAKRFDHFTGRFCHCGGRLLNSTIDFGQHLDPGPLELAEEHSSKADLHLALGSSLSVSPACDFPASTAQKVGGRLVICNLQKTPLTEMADFQIYAETDTVLGMLMEHLGIPVPPFRLLRRIIVGTVANAKPPCVFAKAVDVHNASLEIGILRAVDWDGSGIAAVARKETEAIVAAKHGAHSRVATGLDLSKLRPTFHFVGNYGEPPFQVQADLHSSVAVDVLMSFDPYELSWSCLRRTETADYMTAMDATVAGSSNNLYGQAHREYCIDGVIKKYGKSRHEAVQIVEQNARESIKKARAMC
mmetsp:Transcript_77837/g.166884  ORF Transcript_77837/g.166884 Transcript_77837/m.166884 type:complete len:450 (-) Transcript_77837:339-1688(-)